MGEATELLPCPFCGSTNLRTHHIAAGCRPIECADCWAIGPWKRRGRRKSWNHRHLSTPTPQPAEQGKPS
jgi:hypothetical protein